MFALRSYPALLSVQFLTDRAVTPNPAVTGITFPETSTRLGHTATRDNPHWSAEGKASADIMAALTRGEIIPDEAAAQLKQLYRQKSV